MITNAAHGPHDTPHKPWWRHHQHLSAITLRYCRLCLCFRLLHTHPHTHTEPDLMAQVKDQAWSLPVLWVMLSVTVGNFNPFSELRDHDLRCPKPITARFQSEYCTSHTVKEACPVCDSQWGASTDFLYTHTVRVRDQLIQIVCIYGLPCPFKSLFCVDVDFIAMNQTRELSLAGPLHLTPIKSNNFATQPLSGLCFG